MAYETFRAKLGFVSVVPILITEGAIRGERKTLQAKKHPWGSVHDKNTKRRAKQKNKGAIKQSRAYFLGSWGPDLGTQGVWEPRNLGLESWVLNVWGLGT